MRAQSLAKIHRERSCAIKYRARSPNEGAEPPARRVSGVARYPKISSARSDHTLADGPRGRNRSLFEEENSRATSRMPTIWCRSSPNEVKERIMRGVEGAIARIDARAAGLRRGREEEIPKNRGTGGNPGKPGRNSLVAVGLPHHHGVGVGGLAGGDHGGLVEDGGNSGDSGHFGGWCRVR